MSAAMTLDERRARNEILFREANEEIRRVQNELSLVDGEMPFICECEDERCREVVRMTSAEYERIRAKSRNFAVAPGHDAGTIIARSERFHVSEKVGLEGELVEAADPRKRP
jgi:hypothetical protein